MKHQTQINILIFLLLIFLFSPQLFASDHKSTYTISLNGLWEMGSDRNYTEKVIVPGIPTDPTKMNHGRLWYRKELVLPKGNWKYATLELKGARFSPEVYVNGSSVSKKNGGMAHTYHFLNQKDVIPGNKILLEIALKSLKDIPSTDASYIPIADQWRSNISSGLWDDVVLKLHGDCRIDRIIPFINFNEKKAEIAFNLTYFKQGSSLSKQARIEIFDLSGNQLLSTVGKVLTGTGKVMLDYGDKLKPWSPNEPNLYKLKLSIIEGKDTVDQSIIPFGVKDFRIKNKQFYLNNQHMTLLGSTVVWHRWVRDQEGRELGYNKQWFIDNVIQRLKDHGANYLRFHLGVPPERFLDLCDQYGLVVQYEWNFFHGMPASKESLLEQFPLWLDIAMRHPSVVLIHPYNETEGNQLNLIWDVLNTITKDYPPLVMEERDVIHVHKYWWSLFENLGLYYDNFEQFPKAVMVDEFGGNYLDGEGNIGAYKTCTETFLRFLGRNSTKESRLAFNAMSNGKVAEYWRRIGAAGVAPFCVLGSRNDGNNWFLGKLIDGKPKPVWNALTCAWSPRSISIELWDRNFVPDQRLSLPIYLFNDTPEKTNFNIRLVVKDKYEKIYTEHLITCNDISPFSKKCEQCKLILPSKTGDYIVSAELLNRPETVKYPVISEWGIHVFKAEVPESLLKKNVSVAADEPEIVQFLKDKSIRNVPISDPAAKIILLSKAGWNKISRQDGVLTGQLEHAIKRGTSVILLDVGDRYLGQGYPKDKNDLGPLQGVAAISTTHIKTYDIFGGIKLSFKEAAEPESHLHPDKNNSALWKNIPFDATWLWNGMRGGLIVPATNMIFAGLSSSGFIAQWQARGADQNKIRNENYYAYEMEGFYEFSNALDDQQAKDKLKKKINFLIEDAPALANSLNPLAPVIVTNLSKEYQDSKNRVAENLIPLANAGKNLTRTPIVMIGFGEGKGKLIISQLLTAGRMAQGFGKSGLYGIRYDEVACQFVLNMMELVSGETK